ncbi:MAG: hypothetical protein K8963_04500, partial [Proteobacteria bacterium]|nr:hypothetical protein [Pseudomonadota bacterium]
MTLNRTAAPMLSISAEKVDGRHAVTVSANREIAGSDLDVAINVANTGAPDVPNNDLFTIPVDARFFTRTMSRTDFSGVLDAFTVTLSLTEHENYVIGDSAAVTLKFPSVRPISLTIAQKIKGDARRVGDFSATVGDVVVSLPVTDTQNFASAFSAPIPLVPGKPLTITSNPLATFTPTGAACTNGEYKTTEYELTKDARSFTFTPTLAGGNVGCVLFAEADKIAPKPTPLAPTVTLQTISNGGVATFTFSGAGAASFGPLSIQTTRKNQASSAAPIAANAGRLTVTQAKTPGFAYISAKCAVGDVDLGATVDKAGRKFAVDIPNTGAVACTVTNAGESASTVAVIRNFLRRRLESLTGDTAKSRLIERRNNAGE